MAKTYYALRNFTDFVDSKISIRYEKGSVVDTTKFSSTKLNYLMNNGFIGDSVANKGKKISSFQESVTIGAKPDKLQPKEAEKVVEPEQQKADLEEEQVKANETSDEDVEEEETPKSTRRSRRRG